MKLFSLSGTGGSRLQCLIMALLVAACGSRDQSGVVVAKVGEREISAEEFAFSYELAPRQLTSQEPELARQAVLQRMADVILLAEEAERVGLADDSQLDHILDFRMRQAANRELYLRHVRRKVAVEEAEEREAYRRLKTRLYVKHFETPSYNEAQQLSWGTLRAGHVPVHPWIETIDLPGYGQVDLISWNDIDATLEDLLFDLEPGQTTEPQHFGGDYHVYQLVDKETELLLRENEFQANRESLRGVIRKRKEALASAAFVQEVMGPEELIIKADALNRLARYLWQNRPQTRDQNVQFISNSQIASITDYDREVPALPLAEFRSGTLLVSDILFMYKLHPQQIRFDTEQLLREDLTNMIGTYTRDWVLSELAVAEGLHSSRSVTEEVRSQREKLLADRLRRALYHDLASTGTDSTKLSAEYLAAHDELVRSLRSGTKVDINLDILMAVTTSDEGLSRKIDFTAIRTQ